jgi:hypothetical protein
MMPSSPSSKGPSGVLVWNTFLGSGSNDWSYGIAVDGSGSIYVGGASLGSWGTPVRTFTVSAGNADAFVAKLDGSGTLLWNTFLGGAGSDGVMDLALDGSGSVYVGGYSNAAWGTPVRAYSSGFDILAARLNATTGGLTWNSFMGGAGYEVSGGVALDASDNLYIAGNGDTTWGAPVQAFAGGLRDAIVVQVNSAGALNWNTFLGGPGTDEAYDAALIGTNVVVAGRSDATWGSPWNAYASGYDAFLSEFDSSGNRLANAFFGGAGNDESVGIATDGSGGIVLAGASTATWGDPVRAYSGLLDGMVTKISASLAGISITPTSGLVTTEAGATATFDVVLDSAPTADVSIGLTSSDSSEGTLSTSSLTFTTANWSTPQTVTITGVDDTWIDGSIGYSIITAAAASSDANYNNLNAGDVSVSNTDLDTYNTLIVDTTSDVNDTAQGASVTIAQLMANKGADGKVSLREAITAANNTVNGVGGADRIEFDITDALVGGAHTISLSADLPFIGEAVTLDASTEPDTGGAHVVVIDGASAAANGLEIRASNTHVHGLVLNGFTQRGILVNNGAANVLITGNYVGTDVTGLVARGNGSWGIDLIGAGSGTVIGGDTPAERNVIGAHLGQGGLAINNTQGVTVTGNYIGLGADGITALGNATGIFLINATTGTRIGGIAAGEGNHIAYNLGVGVEIASSNRISVLGNAIYDNGGLGIDLGWDGAVQPNDNGVGDSDIGANNLQNYPVLVSATGDGTDTTLIGTIDSTPDTNFRIEFFSSPSGDTSGYGEGQTYLGFAAVLTDGSGNAAFNTTFAGVSVADGHVVTATATVVNAGVFEDTSEFSAYVAATALNEAPVNSVPGPQSVNEDTPLVIGGISVSDANLASTRLTVSQGTLTVSLAGGASISAGANDSAALTLSGTPTQINEALLTLSYQGDADYNGADTLTVLATDGEGLTDSDTVEISVQPVNDAPLLSTGVSLPGINEDDVTNNGFLVSMLANVATDVDSGALQGLAVTSVDNAHGTWQYTLDGSSWLDIGAVSQTNARLLPSDATARIRFVPDANWNGLTGLFIYHAWDQSSGSAGDLADASVNGGATAFSFGTSGSALSVSPVNDAPLLADSGLEFTVLENSGAPVDGTAVGVPVSDFTGAITDADGAVARGIAIIYSNEADGTWYYTTNGGDNWLAIGTVSDASSLLLADTASTRLYFAPNIDYNGNVFPGLIIRAWDQSSGVAGAKVDTTANGGTTAFSSGIDTIDPTVTAANNAPVISLGAVNLLTNGSFESGGIGWTGNSGVEASATPGNYGIPAPPDGIVFVEVEGYALPAGTASYIEQTVATVVGQTYVVNLSTITRMTFNVQDQGALSINGVEIGQFTTGTTWQDYAASFTATSTSSTLRITSLGSASGLAPLEGDAGGLIVDDVQVVTLQTTAAFTENGAPVVMADAARAYDAELSALNNFDGARLTLARNGGANAEDIFTGSGVLNLSGSDVVLSGITIGTYTNSAGTFQITFNANASNTLVYQAMRQIAYSNSSDAPPASVQIDWTFDDGNTGAQGAGGARSVISSATIIITQQNDPPVLDAIGDQSVAEATQLSFTATATDPDVPPGSLSYSLGGSVPSGASIDADSGVFTWTPTEAQGPGSYTFDVRVSDGQGGSDSETITVTVNEGANQAPILDAIGNQTVTEGNPLTFTATASDADVPPDTLTYSLSGSVPAGAVIDANTGVFTWTPSEAQGPGVYTFDVLVSDGQGGSDSETIQVTVNEGANQAPILDAIGDRTVAEATQLSFTATASDADVPPETLTYSLSGSVPAGAVIDANTGVFTWTPSEAQGPGTYTFDVVVSDGQGGSDSEMITVTVSEGANQAPVLDAIGNQTVTEGNPLTFTATASDADVPPDTLTYSLSGSVPAGAVIDANTGVFTWIPSEAQGPGVYTFDVVVSDGSASDTETIQVTVSEGANQAPVLDAIGNQTVTEGNLLSFTATASDADVPPETLTYSLSGSVPAGAVIDANTGVFTWTPSEAQGPGTYTFDVVVSDGQGGSDSEMITVTVSEGANQAPVLDAIGNQTVTEGNPLTFTATASDADLPPDTLTYSLSGSVPAGAVIDANTRRLHLDPERSARPGRLHLRRRGQRRQRQRYRDHPGHGQRRREPGPGARRHWQPDGDGR